MIIYANISIPLARVPYTLFHPITGYNTVRSDEGIKTFTPAKAID